MAIRLANGLDVQHIIASGGFAFDGRGWLHERALAGLGFIEPERFVVISKSISRYPIVGNLSWIHPWTCIKLIKDGIVNAVGLTNPGFEWWMTHVAPFIKKDMKLVLSLYGTPAQVWEMIEIVEQAKIAILGYEINPSCPNTGHDIRSDGFAEEIIAVCRGARSRTNKILFVKLSVVQKYLHIAANLKHVVDMVNINSVPWAEVFPGIQSPLHKLGGGGVSGKAAQLHTWKMASQIVRNTPMPVAGPSMWEYDDLEKIADLGIPAFAYGGINMVSPCASTRWSKRWDEKHRS